MTTQAEFAPAGSVEQGANLTRFAGLSYVILAAQFMTAIMAGASIAPGYDIHAGAISDLGIEPSTALLFNTSLLVTGILNIVGALAVYRRDRQIIGAALSIAAGVGAIGAAAFPLSTGDVHGIFALTAFVFFNLQIIPAALRTNAALGLVGLALAALGLAYVVVMFIGDGGNPAVFGAIGHGGAERMIVYPPMMWLLCYGGFLMGTGTRDSRS